MNFGGSEKPIPRICMNDDQMLPLTRISPRPLVITDPSLSPIMVDMQVAIVDVNYLVSLPLMFQGVCFRNIDMVFS